MRTPAVAAAIGALAVLSGCFPFKDKGALIASCRMEAATKLRSTLQENDFTFDCMRAQGWVFQGEKAGCMSSMQPECYQPHYFINDLVSKTR